MMKITTLKKYDGKEIAGPIITEKYSSCLYDPMYQANFTAEHFFTGKAR